MKVRKIVIGLNNEDILNFLKLQDKVTVNKVIISNKIDVQGYFKLMSMNINFEATVSICKVCNNNAYLNIDSFKLLKMNIVNTLTKKGFNYFIGAFTDIEGISFENEDFKIELLKIINRYYKEQDIININEFEVNDVWVNKDEIQITFGGIKINTNEVLENNIPYVEAEVVGNVYERGDI